ncbi:MAG TPA: hypothetical protein PLQ93_02710 [Bacteroidia bacterium]|nr:hypothetical protein [Bacteroidia bacterium]
MPFIRILIGVLLFRPLCAQEDALSRNAFLQQDIQSAFEFWSISQPAVSFHSSFRPYLSSTYRQASDSLLPFRAYSFHKRPLEIKIQRSSISRQHSSFEFQPLLDFEGGYDALEKKFRRTVVAGLHTKFNLNQNLTCALTLLAGNAAYPFFLDTSVSRRNLIPEFGQAYPGASNSYAFTDVQGYVSYSPGKKGIFNFQAGRDKHFIGDGYRSVLYSDFGPATPYFAINTNFWRIQYNVWYTWMFDVTSANGVKSAFKNKYGSFHYLSYNIIKELQIGFFENVIWKGTDTNGVRTFDVNYLNPVILLRPQEYALGSSDNSFLGFNLNLTLFKTVKFYGQLGLDEFYFKEVKAQNGWWANKQAWQVGFNYINAFGVKGLKWRFEYNQVRPYTYTHGVVEQNYAHYGQALAHPYGANFKELISIIALRRKNWEIRVQGLYMLIGKDSLSAKSNVGQNIFLSYNTRPYDYGHYTTQGVLNTVAQAEFRCTWFLIPELNLRLEAAYIQRSEENTKGYRLQNPYFYFGIKSSIWSTYKDY